MDTPHVHTMRDQGVKLSRRSAVVLLSLAMIAGAAVPATAAPDPRGPDTVDPVFDANGDIPDPLNFRWTSVSANTAEGAGDYIVMNGNGWIVKDKLTASGSYNHYSRGEGDDCSTAPQLVDFGTWRSDDLVRVELIGQIGAFGAGTIVVDGMLRPEGGSPSSAQLTLNASIEPALVTVEPVGLYLQTAVGEFAPASEDAQGCPIASGEAIFNVLERVLPAEVKTKKVKQKCKCKQKQKPKPRPRPRGDDDFDIDIDIDERDIFD